MAKARSGWVGGWRAGGTEMAAGVEQQLGKAV